MRYTSILVLAIVLVGCPSSTPEAPAPEATAPEAEQATPQQAAPEGSAGGVEAEPSDEAGEAGSGEAAVEAPAPDPQAAIRAEIAGHGPISGPARDVIWGVTEDPAPEMLNATREDLENRHYLTCDEINLHLWYETVKDIGGAYAGVGSDQAYTFIGWMRPQVAWLTDYDPWVRTVHKIYLLAFELNEDIEGFRAFWHEDNEDASWAAIVGRWGDDSDFRLMESVWQEWRGRINRRLRRYSGTLRDAGVPSFLTDEETYDFVREFVQSGRVRPLLANLLDETALHEIGQASRELDVPIRVFYLSNAEDYWSYPDQFRQNFQDLYFDEKSVILRTNASKRTNGDYRYCTQSALNFQQWLQQDYVRRVDDIWHHPYIEDETHIPMTLIDEPPFDRDAD